MSYVRVGSVADLSNKAGTASSVPTIDMSDEPEIIPPPAISRPSASDFSTQRRPAPKVGGGASAASIAKSYMPGGANFQAALAAKKAQTSSRSSGGMSQTTLMLLLAGAGVGIYLLTRKKGGVSPAPAPVGG